MLSPWEPRQRSGGGGGFPRGVEHQERAAQCGWSGEEWLWRRGGQSATSGVTQRSSEVKKKMFSGLGVRSRPALGAGLRVSRRGGPGKSVSAPFTNSFSMNTRNSGQAGNSRPHVSITSSAAVAQVWLPPPPRPALPTGRTARQTLVTSLRL